MTIAGALHWRSQNSVGWNHKRFCCPSCRSADLCCPRPPQTLWCLTRAQKGFPSKLVFKSLSMLNTCTSATNLWYILSHFDMLSEFFRHVFPCFGHALDVPCWDLHWRRLRRHPPPCCWRSSICRHRAPSRCHHAPGGTLSESDVRFSAACRNPKWISCCNVQPYLARPAILSVIFS